MTEKEIFTKFRYEMGFQRSKKYLVWLKEKYPNREPHHLLGSTIGKKYTDYLVVMLTREEHKECEPKIGTSIYNKAVMFVEYLPRAIKHLIEYVESLEGV